MEGQASMCSDRGHEAMEKCSGPVTQELWLPGITYAFNWGAAGGWLHFGLSVQDLHREFKESSFSRLA